MEEDFLPPLRLRPLRPRSSSSSSSSSSGSELDGSGLRAFLLLPPLELTAGEVGGLDVAAAFGGLPRPRGFSNVS